MRFFDAHCDTIGKVWEVQADFTGTSGAPGGTEVSAPAETSGYHPGGKTLHVTLPGLRAAGIRAQVFASWAWTERYKGREFEVAMSEVEAVRRLCDEHAADLFLALSGEEIAGALATTDDAGPPPRIAVVPSLEGTDALLGKVDNLTVFHDAGVRLLTVAWHDSLFCGSTYGNGSGLTPAGFDLIEACEDTRVLVDVSHASDRTFHDICRVAKRPFVASHSNCRTLCPSPRNLTDEMIRTLAERGGVVGITLAPAFLSAGYYEETRAADDEFWQSIEAGMSVEEAGRRCSQSQASVPRPPLDLIVDQVRHAIKVGGEDAVGLGGDLDGVDTLPAGFDTVDDYPRIVELLLQAGLSPARVEKICWGNFTRVFKEVLG